MNKLRRCLKPRLPAVVLRAVLIWLSRSDTPGALGESSFGPLRPSPANPGATQLPFRCLTPNATHRVHIGDRWSPRRCAGAVIGG